MRRAICNGGKLVLVVFAFRMWIANAQHILKQEDIGTIDNIIKGSKSSYIITNLTSSFLDTLCQDHKETEM